MSPDRIVHQKIIARIDPVSRLSSGTSEISLSCTKKDLDRLSLNCRHLIIKSISINGAPIDYTLDELTLDRLVEDELPTNYTGEPVQYPNRLRQALLNGRDKKELTIVLPQPTPENILLRIEYEFEGNFVIKERDDGELKYFQVHQAGMDGMGRHWMPCFEDDNIPWDLEYRISSKGIPANLIQSIHVASSGALCQQFQLADEHESVFQFKLDLPSPPKHISFATGLFDMLRIPAAPFASAFCPLGMASKLSLAVEFLSRTFGFTNWYLGTSFPYPSYYCVFLREVLTAGEPLSSANVSLFSTLDLYNSTIIDQNLIMRNLLCTALAEQYFGIRLQPEGIDSRWLTVGIAGFLTRHMLRIFHGNNDFRYNIKKDMTTLLAMDAGHGAVSEAPEIFANPLDEDWLRLKSYLIIMIFEHRMEKGVIQKVYHIGHAKLLSL